MILRRQLVVFPSFLFFVITGTVTVQTILARSDGSSTSTGSIPRSTHRSPANAENLRYPPWNTSPNIDEHGFLVKTYQRIPGEWEKEFRWFQNKKRKNIDVQTPAQIRQVPGDGNCLFHSISTCYAHALNGTHLDLTDPINLHWLYKNSARLREQAVECLAQQHQLLFLQGHEYLKANDLVQAAASQYGITGEEYCHLMRQDSYWGGGPEIVALCNVLQRPIHVYELAAATTRNNHNHNNEENKNPEQQQPEFVLRRMACFGSPKFDRNRALHILSADSRFPDLTPGRQLASGNHFLALFPKTMEDLKRRSKKGPKLRGGDSRHSPTGRGLDY